MRECVKFLHKRGHIYSLKGILDILFNKSGLNIFDEIQNKQKIVLIII